MVILILFFGTIAVLLLMTGHLIEGRLLGKEGRVLTVLLPVASFLGTVYGLLRFTGVILNASDRYTRESLLFDYSNQTIGCTLLFLCAPLCLGAVIALATRKWDQKT